MRFATINIDNMVIYVLPPKLADEYKVLPPESVEIELDADVVVNDKYEDGKFIRLSDEELKLYFKVKVFDPVRVALFLSTQWVRERHSDYKELGLEDNWDEWLKYWQVLRDMPEQEGFDPMNPVFPEQPK
jgi:hypothetical protein